MTQDNYQVFPEADIANVLLADINNAFLAYPSDFPEPIPMGLVASTPPAPEFVLVAISWEPVYTSGMKISHFDTGLNITSHAQTTERAALMRKVLMYKLIKRQGGKEIIVNDSIQINVKYWMSAYRTGQFQTNIRPFQIQGEHRMIAPVVLNTLVTLR